MRRAPFDLLLADLMMPGMDGITLLRAALQIDPQLVGIIMTGEGTISTAVEAMQSGALDYILKPFKLSAILPVLGRALAMRRLRLENAALEQRVREHAAELETANRELEAFAQSVSHDLRAPLRAVDGVAALLLQKYAPQLSAEARGLLQKLAPKVRQMHQLIDDLLRLSRLGRQALRKEPVDTAALVHSVLKEVGQEQPQRQLTLRVGDLPPAMADPSLLRQVWVNLLSNAYKFTRRKDQALIELGCESRGEERVYFVRDNGAGFDMAHAGELFGAFQRLHRTDEYEGTGVGLSIVQRIVQRHGGRIWAEAVPDQGASFFFTLERTAEPSWPAPPVAG